ncbi:hypothetical protein [Burkholderia pseudomallei]|uniref:hypothetical protein n=1 Tax=Burkholderia pseudomallei TaxID=28450 RepID=UPI00031575F2|nr:hypothetical protein [Burkholderia pseudomallei]ARK60025.1 hypothetical protein BOC37_08785 [Burkholderia pseudomallei]ARK69859.1 hypothetical protein BOC38_24635 [Burkholderia pseudomallei]ARL05724.1 hypothetical protein BOC44_29720 [Burkholderia pseudomallei]ARL41390.1 hypothetical protein BOC49_36885 [Burkholderia pseudomallei]ARL57244.1 hypothetical protein BOC52_12250 [Burkholderia pseudomallei]
MATGVRRASSTQPARVDGGPGIARGKQRPQEETMQNEPGAAPSTSHWAGSASGPVRDRRRSFAAPRELIALRYETPISAYYAGDV